MYGSFRNKNQNHLFIYECTLGWPLTSWGNPRNLTRNWLMGWTILFKKCVATVILLIEGSHIVYHCKEEIKTVSTMYICLWFVTFYGRHILINVGVPHWFWDQSGYVVEIGHRSKSYVHGIISKRKNTISLNVWLINIGIPPFNMGIVQFVFQRYDTLYVSHIYGVCGAKMLPVQ